jgi:phosphoribosyl-ATP pyrophosphohydrolase/phosphoribosyl-AMP cyclohydrolase
MKIEKIDFEKGDGLVPAIIQDDRTLQVLMLGYMNKEAVEKTKASGLVTFYSRSKERLWTKGEESGNTLKLVSMSKDCDNDSLLVRVLPNGPTCHKGTKTCWGEEETTRFGIISNLENVIDKRKEKPKKNSHVSRMLEKGTNKIAQKVGEEAVELVIEAMDDNDELFLEEGADLLFHYLLLLKSRGYRIDDILKVLEGRQKK